MNALSKEFQSNTTAEIRSKKVQRKLWDFHGGVHPKFNKEMSNHLPIKLAEIPSELVVPLKQSMGAGAEPIVKQGDMVFKGQIIAQQTGQLSATVHAPTSGVVTHIGEKQIPHASGLSGLCIVIETDGKDNWGEHKLASLENFKEHSIDVLLERIQSCGIVGLGGAAFPTTLKVDSNSRPNLKTLIVNGAECEPYISCDDRIMRERAPEILQGLDILQYMLQPDHILIGIEDNKPEAIQTLESACANHDQIEVIAIYSA